MPPDTETASQCQQPGPERRGGEGGPERRGGEGRAGQGSELLWDSAGAGLGGGAVTGEGQVCRVL